MILLDMVGDKNLQYTIPEIHSPILLNKLINISNKIRI